MRTDQDKVFIANGKLIVRVIAPATVDLNSNEMDFDGWNPLLSIRDSDCNFYLEFADNFIDWGSLKLWKTQFRTAVAKHGRVRRIVAFYDNSIDRMNADFVGAAIDSAMYFIKEMEL